jgi:serine phosphatase RsbU (regulator of sigma subunit)
VNQLFYESATDGDYATFFFAEYNDKTGRLRYANCGHLAALLLRRDGTLERLASITTVLGFFEDWDCMLEERQSFPGDEQQDDITLIVANCRKSFEPI